MPNLPPYSQQTMLRLVNTDPLLASEYLARLKKRAGNARFDEASMITTLNDMFAEYVLHVEETEDDDGNIVEEYNIYKERYIELMEPVEKKVIPLNGFIGNKEVDEVQRMINIYGWRGLMNKFARYARYQQALQSNAGGERQQEIWEKIEKEFIKLSRHNVST